MDPALIPPEQTQPPANIIFLFFSLCSGGVMIYFDRIEVVNFLIQSAGESAPDTPRGLCCSDRR